MSHLTGPLFHDLINGLKETFFMFWETMWALVFGFTLSGFVQAYVSNEGLQRKLGKRNLSSFLLSTIYGTASSSCSYAASAMSKSLFAKGADFISSIIFLIASTNLVIELGLVLIVLLGWKFLVAQYLGGLMMIALVAILGSVIFSKNETDELRNRVANVNNNKHHCATISSGTPVGNDLPIEEMRRSSLKSITLWVEAAKFAIADAQMLWREMFLGYLVGGLLIAFVPSKIWNYLFLHGHGTFTILENALIGPLIAALSWVCSIGNVPLAAALWSGGISFGGVIAFIFADLISIPLILIYKKFYGFKTTAKLVITLYSIMALSGVLVEGIFGLLGILPANHSIHLSADRLSWDFNTYLNIFTFPIVILWVVLSRQESKLGMGEKYATDPICGMQVKIANAPAMNHIAGHAIYFCSERCKDKYLKVPLEDSP